MDFAASAARAAAVKSGLEDLKAALGIAKDAKELLPDGDQKAQLGKILEHATRKLEEGEVAMADALGYQFCRCQFPPRPMPRVGHLPHARLSVLDRPIMTAQHVKAGDSLAGATADRTCPQCKQADAPAYPNLMHGKKADSPLPLLATPPGPPRPPPLRSSEGWGW